MADTRRDIIQKVKKGGEAMTAQIAGLESLYGADPAAAGSAQKAYVDAVNQVIAAATASMAAYAAATP